MRTLLAVALLAGLPCCTPVLAQAPAAPTHANTPTVAVTSVWARATAGGQTTGAAYLILLSPVADQLVGASTPVAGMAEVHENRMDGTIMRMRETPALDLPAGRAVALAPGGYHVMLMHLTAPLVAGQTFPLHLRFAHAAPVDVTVTVGPIGASGPAAAK